jgi:putative transposase
MNVCYWVELSQAECGELTAMAGNARVRRGLIQLAWRFLVFQKDSALARWYRMRTEGPSGARKTTMIVALARKLLIALWRLVTKLLFGREALQEIAMSQGHNHLNHATWECKYHVVFTPKYRKKLLFGQIRQHLGTVFHELARRKECQIEEGHLMPDHVHILVSIPPKFSVAEVIGYLKGKSSIWVAQNVERKARNFLSHKF